MMGVIVSCRGKKQEETTAPEIVEEDRQSNNASPNPDNVLTPIQTTNDFIRPLENAYPPLPPVDEVEYGPGAGNPDIPRPKTYAVVVSKLAGHKWMKLRLEPKAGTEDNHAEGMDD